MKIEDYKKAEAILNRIELYKEKHKEFERKITGFHNNTSFGISGGENFVWILDDTEKDIEKAFKRFQNKVALHYKKLITKAEKEIDKI